MLALGTLLWLIIDLLLTVLIFSTVFLNAVGIIITILLICKVAFNIVLLFEEIS